MPICVNILQKYSGAMSHVEQRIAHKKTVVSKCILFSQFQWKTTLHFAENHLWKKSLIKLKWPSVVFLNAILNFTIIMCIFHYALLKCSVLLLLLHVFGFVSVTYV